MNDDSKTNEDYRRVSATANKLETIQSNLESVIDFFLTPIVRLYSKLCNDCLKLLFECEFKLDHFRKAEELVWRRIYHDVYRFQKTKRQPLRRHDECLIESHFISGIGFYSSLIVRLRSHYKIYDVQGVIVPLNLTLGPLDNFVDNQLLNEEDNDQITNDDNSMCIDVSDIDHNSKAKEWASQAIYRSLVYMGDLARYLLDLPYTQFNYRNLAFEFYKSASRNQPENGLPFNQLATLAGNRNHNLDAVCNYMRCCMRPKPFEGAEGNMRKIFDLNKKSYDEIGTIGQVLKVSEVLSSIDPSKAAETMMKGIIVTFIKLTADFWTLISQPEDQNLKELIAEETNIFFESLREALELEPIVPLATSINIEQEFCPISGGSSYTGTPKYICSTIMYEFCSISIMLIARCQKQNLSAPTLIETTDVNVTDLVNTLALNLLHYSTSKCLKMITSKVQDLRMNRQEHLKAEARTFSKHSSELGLQSSRGNLSTGSQRSIDNVNSAEATSRRALSRLRKRKAATNYSDNNRLKPIVLHNEDSDMSELEETALSTIDALDISSDMSEDADYKINDLIDLDSSSEENSLPNQYFPTTVGSVNNLSKPILRPTRSQNYELERSLNLVNSSNSLPVPDLLTGDLDYKINSKVSATSQSPEESTSGSDAIDKDSSQSNELNEFESALAYIYNQTYLPTIKIICDWLLSNGAIISSNLLSFRAFCNELGDLVSLLDDLRKITDADSHDDQFDAFKHTYDGPTWIQKYPLSCDFPLLNLEPLKTVHELNIEFKYRRELNDYESGFINIQCMVAFFHALTAFLENKSFH